MGNRWVGEMVEKYREHAIELNFFDCSIWLGPPEGFPLARELQLEELEKEMESSCITGGLISHWLGKTLSAQAGNQALIDLVEKKLFTVWTGLPLFPADATPIPGIDEPHESIRGVRIFPASHNYIPEEWVIGDLCRWLTEHKLPLFIWHTEISWKSLYRLARLFPDLSIILETQTKKILYHTRNLFPIMRECPNVYVETSNFVGSGYIEYTVREFGAHRLIFGSFLPVNDPFVSIGMVLDADIDEKEKKLIASENLSRLVCGVMP